MKLLMNEGLLSFAKNAGKCLFLNNYFLLTNPVLSSNSFKNIAAMKCTNNLLLSVFKL